MNDEIKGLQAEGQGPQGTPAAGGSEAQGAESSEMQSLAANLLQEILPTLEKETKELVENQFKSLKDKRLHQVPEHEDRIGSLEDTARRLEKHLGLGKSMQEATDAVKGEIQQEQFIQDFQAVKERVDNLPTGTGQGTLVEREATILASLGLKADDPKVLAIQQEAVSPEDYVAKLEQSWWDLKNAGRGSVADIPPSQGGPPPTGPSEAEVIAAYEDEMNKLKISGQAGNTRAVTNIRRKYLEKYPDLAGKI